MNKDLTYKVSHPDFVSSYVKYLEHAYGYFKENYDISDENFFEGVILGIRYANEHPSDELIKKICNLSAEYMMSDDENLSEYGEFEFIKNYFEKQ